MDLKIPGKPPPGKAPRRMTPLYNELAEAHDRITSANSSQVLSKLVITDQHGNAEAEKIIQPNGFQEEPQPLPGFKFPMTTEGAILPAPTSAAWGKSQKSPDSYAPKFSPRWQGSPYSSSNLRDNWPTVEDFEKRHQSQKIQQEDVFLSVDLQSSRKTTFRGASPYIETSYGKFIGSGADSEHLVIGDMNMQQPQLRKKTRPIQTPRHFQPPSGTAFGYRAQDVMSSNIHLSRPPSPRTIYGDGTRNNLVSRATYIGSEVPSTKLSNYNKFAKQLAGNFGVSSNRHSASGKPSPNEDFYQHMAENYGFSRDMHYSRQEGPSPPLVSAPNDYSQTATPILNSRGNRMKTYPNTTPKENNGFYKDPDAATGDDGLDQHPGTRADLQQSLSLSHSHDIGFLTAGMDGQCLPAQQQSSSMAEGSTVENIVKQYGRDDFHDTDLESEYEWPSDTDDQGPFALKAPGSDVMETLRLRENPPVRTMRYVSVIPGRKDVIPNPPPVEEPPPIAPPGSSVYGYRSRKSVTRQSSNPWAWAMDENLSAGKSTKFNTRRALEREQRVSGKKRDLERVISEGLRHQAVSDSEMTFADFLRSDRATPSLQNFKDSVDVLNTLELNKRDGAQSKLEFYDSTAIPNIWKDVDRVRVPVNQDQTNEDPVMASRNTEQDSDLEMIVDDTEDDDDGWETVLGSKIGSRMPSRASRKGVRFQNTGSSLADNSSHGNISPIPFRLEHFSSTDKILAHPALMGGVHNLRARENSIGPSPMLMPTYNNRSVNGHFQNSSRFPPTPHRSLYQSNPYHQQPLLGPHENPFLSSPPSVFSPLRLEGGDYISTPTRPSKLKGKGVDRIIHNSNNRLRDPVKPKIAHLGRRVDNDLDEDPSQWVRVSIKGGLSQQIMHRDRTPLSRQPLSFEMVDMVELKRKASSAVLLPLSLRRAPKPKTLCQRIRSKLSYQKGGYSAFKTLPHQTTSRPLCLRDDPVPEIPFMSDGTPPKSFPRQNEFEFRSPLAPVKRESWQALYTEDQLATFRERARYDGVDDLEARWISPGAGGRWMNRRGTYSDRAIRTVNYAPNLTHLDSRPNEGVERKEYIISATCLALCSLFPPLLLFFYMGYWDVVMAWKTSGQTVEMKKCHKKIALWLAPVLTISIVVIIVAIIVGVKFSSRP